MNDQDSNHSLLALLYKFFRNAFYVEPTQNRPANFSLLQRAAIRREPTRQDNPETLAAELSAEGVERPIVFEPALKQFRNALRAGEPRAASQKYVEDWKASRLQVIHHILSTLQTLESARNLVLRGSVLLSTWLNETARHPGDIDWVVLPASIKSTQKGGRRITEEITQSLRGSQAGEGVTIPDQPFAQEEIWTYEKAPGIRMIVPWLNVANGFRGTVQMDFVFGERLPSDPEIASVQVKGFPAVELLAATAEQSLAWKLLWLTTDCYASGKDLYDAVILAEYTKIEIQLIKKTFDLADELDGSHSSFRHFNRESMLHWEVEWNDFVKEYPEFATSPNELKQRLSAAMDEIWQQCELSK